MPSKFFPISLTEQTFAITLSNTLVSHPQIKVRKVKQFNQTGKVGENG
ncbi:MAG: hypothetical protein Ct9H90mP30_5810 [Actinomycetota bacterium]|nr:MAG: hypothetical protein Ct9H90mP30_5810 [Actinomycetota bacterium]